jgi:hypothetical protein
MSLTDTFARLFLTCSLFFARGFHYYLSMWPRYEPASSSTRSLVMYLHVENNVDWYRLQFQITVHASCPVTFQGGKSGSFHHISTNTIIVHAITFMFVYILYVCNNKTITLELYQQHKQNIVWWRGYCPIWDHHYDT